MVNNDIIPGYTRNNDIIICVYPLIILTCYGKQPSIVGKSTINGPFSIAIQ